MNIVVIPDAKELVLQEGGAVTIRLEPRLVAGCSNSPQITPTPSVKMGEPAEHEQAEYKVFAIDGVTVYAHTALPSYDNETVLRIATETTLFGKRLVLYGLPAPEKNCGTCTSC